VFSLDVGRAAPPFNQRAAWRPEIGEGELEERPRRTIAGGRLAYWM